MAEEKYVFAFGSETGNSEHIARRLFHVATEEKKLTGVCMNLNQMVTDKVLDTYLDQPEASPPLCLVIVCSTTGEGEPPGNATRFRRFLRNCKGKLHHLRYTVLALGDTNYNNFCAAGIYIDNKLLELGGTRFYPRGEADDGVGLDLVVEPWTMQIWDALLAPAAPDAVVPTTYHTGQQRVDMAVAQEAAIIYSNASQICSVMALFLFERITELGGKSDLYPIQYFSLQKLAREPKILFFILCTDSDVGTVCEHCGSAGPLLPPLGAFTDIFFTAGGVGGGAALPTESEETASLRKWMADPAKRYYSAICIVPKPRSIPRGSQLSRNVAEVAAACRLEQISKKYVDAESSGIASNEEDLFRWAEAVLDTLPGVTAEANEIHKSLDYFFDNRVGAAFRESMLEEQWMYQEGVRDGAIATNDRAEKNGSNAQSSTADRDVPGRHRTEQPDARSRDFNSSCTNSATVGVDGTDANSSLYTHSNANTFNRLSNTRLGLASSSQQSTVSASHTPSRRIHHHHQSKEEKQLGISERNRHRNPFDPVLTAVLSPLVFLYTGSSSFVVKVANDLHKQSEAHHLRSSLVDLSNIRQTGFPRRGIFIFVIASVLTKTMSKVLKSLRLLSTGDKSFSDVKFAILGVDERSHSGQSNAYAMEIETLLLSLSAVKIHSTGLADLERTAEAHAIIESWSRTLWSAIINPTPSRAYIDYASPTINRNLAFPACASWLDHNGGSSFAEAGAVTMPAVMTSTDATTAGAGDAPSLAKDATTPTGTPALPNAAPAAHETNAPTACNSTATHAAAVPAAVEPSGSPLSPLGSLWDSRRLQWEAVPINKSRAPQTGVVFFYSSAGMPKSIASQAMGLAKQSGFRCTATSLSKFSHVSFTEYPNVVLFCESSPSGASIGGKRFKQHVLRNAIPDLYSHVRFAVMGLGEVPPGVPHPAHLWASMLLALHATRVFPVLIMPTMSLVHSRGLPWCHSVLGCFTQLPPLMSSHCDKALAVRSKGVALLFLYDKDSALAESVARDYHLRAQQAGFYSRVAAMEYYDRVSLIKTDYVVFVCATPADVSQPYSSSVGVLAGHLQALVRGETDMMLTAFSQCAYAVLSLGWDEVSGDGVTIPQETYHSSSSSGSAIDVALATLGGRRVLPMDHINLNEDAYERIETWRECLFVAVRRETTSRPSAAVGRYGRSGVRLASGAGDGSSDGLDEVPSYAEPQHRIPLIIATACSDSGVAHDIVNHLRATLAAVGGPSTATAEAAEPPAVMSMTTLVKKLERSEMDGPVAVIFVVQNTSDGEYQEDAKYAFRTYIATCGHRCSITSACVNADSAAGAAPASAQPSSCQPFKSIYFTVLGLQERNAGDFQQSQLLDRRLEELGGTRFYTAGEVIDSYRLHKTMERWTAGLLKAAEHLHDCNSSFADSHDGLVPDHSPVSGSRADDSMQHHSGTASSQRTRMTYSMDGQGQGTMLDATVHSFKRLTSDSAPAEIYLLNFCLPERPVAEWRPGQCITMMPRNDPELVYRILAHFPEVSDDLPFDPLSIAGSASSSFPSSPIYEHVDFPLTCYTLLHRYLSLRVGRRRREWQQMVLGCCKTSEDTKLVEALFKELNNERYPREVADILDDLPPTVHIPFRHFVEHLGLMQPRNYSIASSCRKHPKHLSLCFKVEHKGLCSTWLRDQILWAGAPVGTRAPSAMPSSNNLADLHHDGQHRSRRSGYAGGAYRPPQGELVLAKKRCVIPIYVRSTVTDFKLPRDPLLPIILVGAGTGFAPFRAFLQEREMQLRERTEASKNDDAGDSAVDNKNRSGADGAVSDKSTAAVEKPSTDVFFGCRRRHEDYLFGDELMQYKANSLIGTLSTAFSREPNDGTFWYGGCYVQDRLQECGVSLAEMLTQQNARIFVCGDAEHMCKDVHRVLVELIQSYLRLSDSEVTRYIDTMVNEGRYVRDLWVTSEP